MQEKIKIAYLTKAGDTLEKLAQNFGTTKQQILKDNKNINKNLHIGQLLTIIPALINKNEVKVEQELDLEKRRELFSSLQKAFEGMIFWVHNFITSTIEEKDDITQVQNRILLIPEDFTKIFKPYYTEQELFKLENVIREHFIIFSRLIGSLKRNSPVEYDQYNKELYENTAELSKIIIELNPNLNEVILENLFIDYVDNLKRIMSNRYNETYVQEI